MFMGTLVPELFEMYRRKIKNKLRSAPLDGADGDRSTDNPQDNPPRV